jgi:hypothetical protein
LWPLACLLLVLLGAGPVAAAEGGGDADALPESLRFPRSAVGETQVQAFVPVPPVGEQAPVLARTGEARHWQVQLPADVHQGPDTWWLFRVRLGLERVSAAPGQFVVTAATNGHAAVRVKVTVEAGGLHATGGGLVGQANGQAPRRLAFAVENYVQVRGLKPGANDVSVRIDGPKGQTVAPFTAVLAAGSGLGMTAVGPNETGIRTMRGQLSVRSGRQTSVPYELVRRGGRPDRPVRLFVQASSRNIRISEPIRDFARLDGGKKGRFTVTGSVPGRYSILVGLLGNYNSPTVAIPVIVEPAGHGAGPYRPEAAAAGATALAFLFTGSAVFLRRRQRAA